MEPSRISQKRLVYNVHCCVKAKKRQPANIPTNPFLFKWTKVATAVHILGRLGPSQCCLQVNSSTLVRKMKRDPRWVCGKWMIDHSLNGVDWRAATMDYLLYQVSSAVLWNSEGLCGLMRVKGCEEIGDLGLELGIWMFRSGWHSRCDLSKMCRLLQIC